MPADVSESKILRYFCIEMIPKNYTTEDTMLATKKVCGSDCSNCRTFPAPYRRIGESASCRFTQQVATTGSRFSFPADSLLRILFVLEGGMSIEACDDLSRNITRYQCVCLPRGSAFEATATADTRIVLLSMMHRIEFCESDIFDREMPHDTVVPVDRAPMLDLHPAIARMLADLFEVRALTECTRYHRMKTSELFMMIKVLYTSAEHAYFFQSMIQPQDNFRVFVCNNYDKAESVSELASLAGMSLSVFKRRFSEHFDDSVYHWMMRQKALKIFTDIRDGEDNTKALMAKYGFKYYTQFSRFCKTYLQATPVQLIDSIREG